MQLVSYSIPAGRGFGWRECLRLVAGEPSPALPGLASRWWRVDGDRLRGYYLFDNGDAVTRFLTDPCADPSFRRVAARAGITPQPDAVGREVGALDVLIQPLFVIAAPRSGSTLLYDVLCDSAELWSIGGESEGVIEGVRALHPGTRGFDSNRLTDIDTNDMVRRAIAAGLLTGLRDRGGARYLDIPETSRPAHVRIVEKTPENALRISFLSALFPDARFVFLHRDARQSVSSIRAAWDHPGFVKYPELPGWDRRSWHLLLPEGWRELNNAALIDVAAFQWAEANRQALEDLDALPREAWTVVDYAELVASPEATVRRICAFADIEVDDHLADVLAKPLPLSDTTITPPSPLKWRSDPHFRPDVVDRHRQVAARLRDLGRLSAPPPPRRLRPSAVRFACFLDDVAPVVPDHTGELIVAPSFQYQLGASIPVEIAGRTRHRDRFLDDRPRLWVDDPATGFTYAYWADRSRAFHYTALVAGRPVPDGLTDAAFAQLVGAGVITTQADLDRACAFRQAATRRAFEHFRERGHCTVPAALRAPYVAALDRYYRALVAAGSWEEGDEQVQHRHGMHNESVARYIHHQLVELVSAVTGEAVKPTYCYVSAYERGAVLRPHVDRRQCVFTVSLWLDSDPGDASEPWPLWLDTDTGRVAVTQVAGDAVVFLGCDLPHWREPTSGRVSTTLLLHYVPIDFAGSLD